MEDYSRSSEYFSSQQMTVINDIRDKLIESIMNNNERLETYFQNDIIKLKNILENIHKTYEFDLKIVKNEIMDAIDNNHNEIQEIVGILNKKYLNNSEKDFLRSLINRLKIDPAMVKIGEEIGNGAYGTVHLATYGNKNVAVKKIVLKGAWKGCMKCN